nr:probable E3 ubiquitin-protein ligase RNF217 [Coffea arabica]
MERVLKYLREIVGGSGESRLEVSDAEYAEKLQVEEALQASLANLQISHHKSPSFKAKQAAGESQTTHVEAKIQENIHMITCPTLTCDHIIQPFSLRGIIPEIVFARWEKAWNEATIPDSQKFYCPFKDCSAMLLNDDKKGKMIRQSECPVCRRLFCARCYVPWHGGFNCKQFQKLKVNERGSDDLKVHVLTKEKKWTKCPNCNYVVDKVAGCIHMTCRCKFEFCYKCGSKWSARHWRCQA